MKSYPFDFSTLILWKNSSRIVGFELPQGLIGQKRCLPKNSSEAVSEGNFSPTFWAKPVQCYQ